MQSDFFPDFDVFDLTVFDKNVFDKNGGELCIHGVVGGAGPPLLLLHGYPQTHVMWHRVAPRLAEHYTVVAADLRGYGASGKPAGGADHAPYAKRAMADDMVQLMSALGHERFYVCGHDRGARVAHRLAIDHPGRVERLMTLDIAPTREMYRHTDDAFARAYWHWFFLILPAPRPEEMIGADSDRYFRHKCGSGAAGLSVFDPVALEVYLEAFRNPATIHASCEDYRAAATIDLVHDDADDEPGVTCPLRVLWGEHGIIGRCFDPLALWRERAREVSGHALPGGHYLAEECPDEVLAEMCAFFI